MIPLDYVEIKPGTGYSIETNTSHNTIHFLTEMTLKDFTLNVNIVNPSASSTA